MSIINLNNLDRVLVNVAANRIAMRIYQSEHPRKKWDELKSLAERDQYLSTARVIIVDILNDTELVDNAVTLRDK